MHLDDKDDDAAGEGDEVGKEQEDTLASEHPTLKHKGKTANRHHDKARQGDAVGVTRTNGLNGLRQIAEDKADAGYPTKNVE